MSHRENITRIKAVHQALEELAADVVFVGGATVSFYSTRPETETRPTDDVDIVVEIIQYFQPLIFWPLNWKLLWIGEKTRVDSVLTLRMLSMC